tara:strand:+ start:799 stop:1227 length:429 start_codon:yes stop_codon:yes gene_type:complete
MIDTSGIIGDKEVEMHKLAKFVWAIDIVRHTSDDTKELVEGWEIGDEQKAYALYDEKIRELKQFEYPDQFQYPEETWSSVNLEGLIYDCNFWTEDDGQKYITFYQCFMDGEKKKYMNTDVTDNFVTFKLIPTDPNMGSKGDD